MYCRFVGEPVVDLRFIEMAFIRFVGVALVSRISQRVAVGISVGLTVDQLLFFLPISDRQQQTADITITPCLPCHRKV